jgi:hypothetical protein
MLSIKNIVEFSLKNGWAIVLSDEVHVGALDIWLWY